MPTMDEKFKAYWASASASDSPRVAAISAFLAGAEAEREVAKEAAIAQGILDRKRVVELGAERDRALACVDGVTVTEYGDSAWRDNSTPDELRDKLRGLGERLYNAEAQLAQVTQERNEYIRLGELDSNQIRLEQIELRDLRLELAQVTEKRDALQYQLSLSSDVIATQKGIFQAQTRELAALRQAAEPFKEVARRIPAEWKAPDTIHGFNRDCLSLQEPAIEYWRALLATEQKGES